MGSFQIARPTVDPIQAPDVLGNFQRIQALRGAQQEQQFQAQEEPNRQQILQNTAQTGQMQVQDAQQAQKDQQAASVAFQKWDGKSYDDLAKEVVNNGGSYKAAQSIVDAGLKQRADASKLQGEALDQQIKKNGLIAPVLASLDQIPDEQLPQAVMSKAQELAQQGLLDPPHMQAAAQLAQSGDPVKIRAGVASMLKGVTAYSQILDEQKQAETDRHNKAMELKPSEGMQGLNDFLQAKTAAKGSPLTAAEGLAARNEYYQRNKSQTNTNGGGGNSDAKETAHMIAEGKAPPILTEQSFRDRTAIAAELHRMGYNLAGAEQDWKATQKFLQTANGAQQTRLRQAITALPDLTDKIEGLYNEWAKLAPVSGFKVLNRATLGAMKNSPGRAGAVAQALDAQIADAVSDLAVVYMGGNSPTDHGLALAQKNLSTDWNDETFREGLKQLKSNVAIRKNSLNVGPTGVSGNSPYSQGIGGGTQPEAASSGNVIRYKIVNGQLVAQ